MDKTKKESSYQPPALTVVSFKLERGFASSPNPAHILWDRNESDTQMEDYSTREGWGSGGNFWD